MRIRFFSVALVLSASLLTAACDSQSPEYVNCMKACDQFPPQKEACKGRADAEYCKEKVDKAFEECKADCSKLSNTTATATASE